MSNENIKNEALIGGSELNAGLGLHTCCECGMQTEIVEYHPYAACLMFKACHDSETVQANLDSVIAHGYQLAYQENPPVRREDIR